MTFRKILCPTDFSPGSREALRVAAELASEPATSLVIAHVWEPSRWLMGNVLQASPTISQDMIDVEEAELARWKHEARAFGAKEIATLFLRGAPWDQIVTAARERAVDLIVMGTHGRTGLSHALLGSVAEKVVRHAPCAVLVTRPPEAT